MSGNTSQWKELKKKKKKNREKILTTFYTQHKYFSQMKAK